jgi:hypothetical protein
LVLVKLVEVVAVIVVWAAGVPVIVATPPLPTTRVPALTLVSALHVPLPNVKVISPVVAEGVKVTA